MPSATQAFISTYKEVLDSKKWTGSYLQVIIAICLVQFLHWSLTDAMIVSAPIALAVASQAHVDASAVKAGATKDETVVAPVQNVVVPPPAPEVKS